MQYGQVMFILFPIFSVIAAYVVYKHPDWHGYGDDLPFATAVAGIICVGLAAVWPLTILMGLAWGIVYGVILFFRWNADIRIAQKVRTNDES